MMTSLFEKIGIKKIYHISPLHYLPYICRKQTILPKDILGNIFDVNHFRSKSDIHDRSRGFSDCCFLTTSGNPPIIKAKLTAGFPHIRYEIPAHEVERYPFSLCRFNIAMTRYLRRGMKPGHPESKTNGRYYDNQEIPTARSFSEKYNMLVEHYPNGIMIEVLVHAPLRLSNDVVVVCFSDDDYLLAENILKSFACSWEIRKEHPPCHYNRNPEYVSGVEDFLAKAMSDPDWRGNGLEYDKI